MKVKMFTHWINGEMVCCCLVNNKCRKDHNCEELEFTLEKKYKGIKECFKNSEKKR